MYKKIIIYLVIITLIWSTAPLSIAQELPPEETTPEAGEEKPEAAQEAQPAEREATPGNITIDFKDADINNVLRILSYKSGVNIVAGKDVAGVVTIRLVNVPWEKALDVVLKTYRFAYERDGNIIRVTTVENLSQEPLKTEVFTISYAKADEVTDSVKVMLSERGSVRADKRSNTIIVTDIPTNIYKIEQVITKLDEPTPQVYIDARVIETTIDDDEKLGINWTIQATAAGSKLPSTLPFNREIDDFKMFRHSIPLGDTSSTATTNVVGKFPSTTNTGIDPAFPMSVPGNFTFGTLDFSQFSAVLYLLNTRSDTKVISNPRTVTLNNQEATIHIGTSIYVPEWKESTTTGSPVFSGITKTKLDTGIKLKVTPHVNSKNEIVVDLEPEVSTLGTATAMLTDSSGRTINYFPVSIRTAKTQVMVKDGETIAIGGLMKEESGKVRNKVPFLGDIPILGHLFRYSYDSIDTKDLLIFVTVKLVETKEETAPLFGDINERMDKFDNAAETMGHQYDPDTSISTFKQKKKSTKLIVE